MTLFIRLLLCVLDIFYAFSFKSICFKTASVSVTTPPPPAVITTTTTTTTTIATFKPKKPEEEGFTSEPEFK